MSTEAEFEEFARARARHLHRSAWLMCGDVHQSEDLVQETLARVYVRWTRRFGARIENPAAYAQTTLTRVFIDSRRRRSAHEKPTDTLPDRGVDDSPVVRLALAEALAGLDELDRVVLVRRYLDDAPVAVVANELGISEGAVRNRSLRALDRLRARFGADLSDLRAP